MRDRATYTAAELARYGLPQRTPGEPFDKWARIIRSAGKRACDGTVTNVRNTSDLGWKTWAGNIADEPCCFSPETYSEADVEFWVPSVSGTQTSYASFWVGLGGFWQGNNLVQTGVVAHRLYIANYGWFTTYDAWVENLGDAGTGGNAVNVFSVNPGDLIYAKVNNGNCMFLEDFSASGMNTLQCYGPNADVTSAEAVAERPELCDPNCSQPPLANFGQVTFLGLGITDNSQYKGIAQVNHDYSNMRSLDGSRIIASVGPIFYDGSQNPPYDYTVAWQSYS